jgi:hypothetical protein
MFDFSCECSVTVAYGQTLNPASSPDQETQPGAKFLCDLLATTLRFLRQQIVRPEARAVQNKGARQALTKKLGRTPPEVQVIRMREYADADQPARADAGERDWSGRWMVRGHWHQYRVGPGRQRLEPRYVAPYVKGPQDKPLVLRQKVVAVQR